MCTVQSNEADSAGGADADDDDNNNSFRSPPPAKSNAAKHFRWNEISNVKFGGKHFRPEAPACIHIIFHTFMLRLLYS